MSCESPDTFSQIQFWFMINSLNSFAFRVVMFTLFYGGGVLRGRYVFICVCLFVMWVPRINLTESNPDFWFIHQWFSFRVVIWIYTAVDCFSTHQYRSTGTPLSSVELWTESRLHVFQLPSQLVSLFSTCIWLRPPLVVDLSQLPLVTVNLILHLNPLTQVLERPVAEFAHSGLSAEHSLVCNLITLEWRQENNGAAALNTVCLALNPASLVTVKYQGGGGEGGGRGGGGGVAIKS